MLGKGKEKADAKEMKAAEAGLPKAAVEAEVKVGKEIKKVEQKPVNELVFKMGEAVELKKLPFEVVELTGAKVVLKRKDIV